MKMLRSLVFLLAVALGGGAAAETILIEEPMTYGVSKADLETLEILIEEAAGAANALYGNYFEAAREGRRPDYTVSIMPVFQAENSVMVVNMTRTRDEVPAQPFNIFGEIEVGKARFLANALFYLWSSYHGYLADRTVEPPAFVAELPTSAFAEALLEGATWTLTPWGAAAKRDGRVIFALTSLAAETDRYLKIVDDYGGSLLEKGTYDSSAGVAVTPGDTVFLKPATGRHIYYLPGGVENPVKWSAGVDLGMAGFVGLADGSVVVMDPVKKQAMRIAGRKREPLDLFTNPYSTTYAIATGPEGNLWLYDFMEKRVRIYTPEGRILDSIAVLADPNENISPFSMAVYRDGRFLLYSTGYPSGKLYCFRRDGSLLWRMDSIPKALPDPLPMNGKVSVDSSTGLIYITDMQGFRVIQLLDVSYAADMGLRDEHLQEIVELNRRLLRDDADIEAAAAKAEIYETLESFYAARAAWEEALAIDPFDERAQERLDRLEISLLKAKARRLRDRAVELLERLGPGSAQQSYSQALKHYERALSLEPDPEARSEMEDLKRLYEEKTSPPASRKPLTIVRAEVADLFPSLMQYYRRNAVGEVTVRNDLQEPVDDLKARLNIRKYIDFPVASAWEGRLEPGQEATLPLKVLFNDAVFSLQEDLPIQAEIEISCTAGGAERTSAENVSLTLFRRTALTWDDSAKLASFVVPNEGIVSRFSHRVASTRGLEDRYRISEKFYRTVRICEAVGAYGIDYIEDPDSPISEILGKAAFVDTVRFPRTTLLLKSGDCDDSTVLLASLLESSGIGTAIMTSPGHVFLAANTGEPDENLWLFQTEDLEAMAHLGSVWLPVETTALSRGFYEAWSLASGLVRKHGREGAVEFLPLETARITYPALPLPESSFTVVEPEPEALDPVFLGSVERVNRALYDASLAELESRRSRASGSGELKVRNQIAVLHARFGEDREAEKVFRGCIRSDPDYLSSYVNLANLLLARDEGREAVSVLEEGLERKPDSALLHLLLGRAHLSRGDRELAMEQYERLEELSPRTAERYAGLFGIDEGSVQRAANPTGEYPFIWDAGD